jgi:hypothetical protein
MFNSLGNVNFFFTLLTNTVHMVIIFCCLIKCLQTHLVLKFSDNRILLAFHDLQRRGVKSVNVEARIKYLIQELTLFKESELAGTALWWKRESVATRYAGRRVGTSGLMHLCFDEAVRWN